MSLIDLQKIQLLHQIQSHNISILNALLLLVILNFPDPFHWIPDNARFNLYFNLAKQPVIIASSHHLSPFWALVLLEIYPLLFLGALVFVVLLAIEVYRILRLIFGFILRQFVSKEEKIFLELTFPHQTSQSAYSTEQLFAHLHTVARQKLPFPHNLMGEKNSYSFEIVSTRKEGIRYFIESSSFNTDILERALISYVPGIKVKRVDDYFQNKLNIHKLNRKDNSQIDNYSYHISDLTLSGRFVLPLKKQKVLGKHDPISFLTGNMTKLHDGELVSFQIVTTPVLGSTHKRLTKIMDDLTRDIYEQKPITGKLKDSIFDKILSLPVISLCWLVIKLSFLTTIFFVKFVWSMAILAWDTTGKTAPLLQPEIKVNLGELLNPYEKELSTAVKEKIDQPLFETNIRLLVIAQDRYEAHTRSTGFVTSFGPLASTYQSIVGRGTVLPSFLFHSFIFRKRLSQFKARDISSDSVFDQNPILSVSELSDLYHPPYSSTTKTENMAKMLWKELPAPLSLKQGAELDVVFGENTYGNDVTPIGLIPENKNKHLYMIGQTGMGKSTVIYHMVKGDMEKGRGVGVVDPHGDLAEDLLNIVPEERMNDLIYVNPIDLQYNVHINLLELPEGLSDDDLELEKELVSEGVISLFRREFSEDDHVDAHRIEYILRNTIYTAFALKERTIFTIYDLLNDPDFRRNALRQLDDKNLQNFWKNEYGNAGNYQIVKMVGGVTARVGKYLFSPTARRILEHNKSTISFDDIVNKGLILICNLSEGNLGEDTSQMLGTMIITLIHQAVIRRSRKLMKERKPLYLYVDEFQNFATTSFTRMLSSGRKFGLTLTIAEQSTAQQKDRSVVDVILTNVGHMISFKTAGPVDTTLMVDQLAPDIEKTDLMNLPSHHFYIKLSNITPEEPFSGVTLPITKLRDEVKIQRMIEASRKNWTVPYMKPQKPKKTAVKEDQTDETKGEKNKKGNQSKNKRKPVSKSTSKPGKTGLPGTKKNT